MTTQNDWENSHDFKQAVYAADILLDTPYADPDDDIRTVARQFNRMVERYNALAKELADARREVIIDRIDRLKLYEVIENIYLSGMYTHDKGILRQYMSDIINVLATLRKEGEK